MTPFDRTRRGLLARWWWTVDRPLLAALGLIALCGLVVVLAASPPAATRLGLGPWHFVGRQALYMVPATLLLLGGSLLAPRGVYRLAVGLFALVLLMLAWTLLFGIEIKGATRWMSLFGLVIQPSEFIKPLLVVVAAGLLARAPGLGNAWPAILLGGVVILLLLGQPDVGMTLMVASILGLQLFLAGLPWLLVLGGLALGGLGLVQAYFLFPHVRARIDHFLDPAAGDQYQIGLARKAIEGTAWFGSGPGEGRIKYVLPDAHSDFVFAVVAEEFGLIAGLVLLGLFGFVVLRGIARAEAAPDRFSLLAAAGLLAQLGLQALVNLGVNLSLLPATGMTLPLISYGGSSLCALGLGMGLFLALTRRRPGQEAVP
jgi:cell division protein FtsW